MAKSKNKIAQDLYGEDFDYLSGGEKAAVTRAFNAQGTSSPRRPIARAVANSVTVELGRVGDNGVKKCILPKGSVVGDLIEQAAYYIDEDKEKIIASSTGLAVDDDDVLKNGEVYVITPEIRSA